MLARLTQFITQFLSRHFDDFVHTATVSIAQEFMKKGRKTLLFFMTTFVFSLLLTAGVIISLLDASSQYDERGRIVFSAMLTSSLSLVIVSLVFFVIAFWPRKTEAVEIATVQSPQPTDHIEQIFHMFAAKGADYLREFTAKKSSSATDSRAQTL